MKSSAILLILAATCAPAAAMADPLYDISQLIKKGKQEQALEMVNSYLSGQPKDAWGRNITQMRFLKGTLLAEQKRTAEAIQVFAKLTQDYPDLPEPYNNLAALYAAQGRHEEARDALERALRTDPAYATAYRNLNEIYARIATQAYDNTLQASKGERPAPALIKELCDNYGRMANQAVGRKQPGSSEISLLHDIPKSRTSAAAPPSKIDIDEMAVASTTAEPALPPAFNNPAITPAPRVPSVVVAPKTEPAKLGQQQTPGQETQPSAGDEQSVLSGLRAWASAWSRKDTAAYLAFYAKDFRTPNGQLRTEWAKLRRERIGKPKSIKVSVDAPKVTFNDTTHATVSFRQGYRSDELQTSTHKTLLMVKTGGKWLIQEERVGN